MDSQNKLWLTTTTSLAREADCSGYYRSGGARAWVTTQVRVELGSLGALPVSTPPTLSVGTRRQGRVPPGSRPHLGTPHLHWPRLAPLGVGPGAGGGLGGVSGRRRVRPRVRSRPRSGARPAAGGRGGAEEGGPGRAGRPGRGDAELRPAPMAAPGSRSCPLCPGPRPGVPH